LKIKIENQILIAVNFLIICMILSCEAESGKTSTSSTPKPAVSLTEQVGTTIDEHSAGNVINVEGKPINMEEPNAGGCSGTYFPKTDPAYVVECMIKSEYCERELARNKAMHDYLWFLLNKSQCPFKQGDLNSLSKVESFESFIALIACLGTVTTRKTFCGPY
jgi:hypothetical protein